MKNELYLKCECNTHILGLEIDKEHKNNPIFMVSFWVNKSEESGLSLWQKIKTIFKFLFREDALANYIILDLNSAKELNAYFSEHIKGVDNE